MIDDDVITRIVELHDHIAAPDTPPGADVFRGQRMLRRRRTGFVVAAAAAVVVAVLGIGAVGHQAGDRVEPARPVPTPRTDGEWTPELIRAEGRLQDEQVTESGIATRTYVVCDGTPSECAPTMDGPIRRAHEHMAIEVAQDGQSALFGVHRGDQDASVTAFDAESVLVMDLPPEALGNAEDVRFRLLRADGTEILLRLVVDPIPPVPGPEVTVIDLGWLSGDEYGQQHAVVVDESERTLRPLGMAWNADLDRVGSSWGPNTDEFLWFVSHIDCRVFWLVDGTVETGRPCGGGFRGDWETGPFTDVQGDWFPEGWLVPGRMALLEHGEDRLILHVSLDYGNSWRAIPIRDEMAIADRLQELG